MSDVHVLLAQTRAAYYVAVLAQAYQRLWLVVIDDVYQQFTDVGLAVQPSAPPH